MDHHKLYYIAPSDENFVELKREAIKMWADMGDEWSYPEEKIGSILKIKNVSDNFMYMVAMFDHGNQCKLAERLSEDTREAIRERMISGGNPLSLIPF